MYARRDEWRGERGEPVEEGARDEHAVVGILDGYIN